MMRKRAVPYKWKDCRCDPAITYRWRCERWDGVPRENRACMSRWRRYRRRIRERPEPQTEVERHNAAVAKRFLERGGA